MGIELFTYHDWSISHTILGNIDDKLLEALFVTNGNEWPLQ